MYTEIYRLIQDTDDAEAILALSSMNLEGQDNARSRMPYDQADQAMGDLIQFGMNDGKTPDEHSRSRIPVEVLELIREAKDSFETIQVHNDGSVFLLVGEMKEGYATVYYPMARWSSKPLLSVAETSQAAIKKHLVGRALKLLEAKAEVEGAISVNNHELKQKPFLTPSKRNLPSLSNY